MISKASLRIIVLASPLSKRVSLKFQKLAQPPGYRYHWTTMASSATKDTIPAVFYRGGTSNALMIHARDLPSDQSSWQPILAGALGSPDSYKRQLNGMGGGVSSLSKICVVAPPSSSKADVEFTFIQMGITDGKMDLVGTCGNMTSAVGPFAVDEGIFTPKDVKYENGETWASIRIWNTNTSKIIESTFAVEEQEGKLRFKYQGDFAIDGVSGSQSCITLRFLEPGGAKTGKLLPTGNAVDMLKVKNPTSGESLEIEATLVDAANPAVIIKAEDINIAGDILPVDLDANQPIMDLLEQTRRQGAAKMGMDPEVDSVPKMMMVSAPKAGGDSDVNIVARVLSMRQAHKAIPLTIALNLGVACGVESTIPNLLRTKTGNENIITIGHPGGKIEVGAVMKDGQAESAVLYRTARPLMKGEVFWR
jgi:2-methylaconitate cis-trans-isomerase PrpF